jgi:hypothetical protein
MGYFNFVAQAIHHYVASDLFIKSKSIWIEVESSLV